MPEEVNVSATIGEQTPPVTEVQEQEVVKEVMIPKERLDEVLERAKRAEDTNQILLNQIQNFARPQQQAEPDDPTEDPKVRQMRLQQQQIIQGQITILDRQESLDARQNLGKEYDKYSDKIEAERQKIWNMEGRILKREDLFWKYKGLDKTTSSREENPETKPVPKTPPPPSPSATKTPVKSSGEKTLAELETELKEQTF